MTENKRLNELRDAIDEELSTHTLTVNDSFVCKRYEFKIRPYNPLDVGLIACENIEDAAQLVSALNSTYDKTYYDYYLRKFKEQANELRISLDSKVFLSIMVCI